MHRESQLDSWEPHYRAQLLEAGHSPDKTVLLGKPRIHEGQLFHGELIIPRFETGGDSVCRPGVSRLH
jgi:hypothetical protein